MDAIDHESTPYLVAIPTLQDFYKVRLQLNAVALVFISKGSWLMLSVNSIDDNMNE